MKALIRLTPMMLAATLVSVGAPGCGDDDDTNNNAGTMDAGPDGGRPADAGVGDASTASAEVATAAADLRTNLNLMLSEHLVLASKATGAALAGRTSEYKAYGALLNTNGTELGAMIGSAYGAPAETEFNRIWSAHNGFFVNYTVGAATNDQAMKMAADNNLRTVYVPEFAALLAMATQIPDAALRSLILEHVTTTEAIIDAQKANDWGKVYTQFRGAFKHMAMLGDPLAKATASRVPTKFPGNTDTKSVGFRVAFNELLQEHLYLASFATNAALGGRTEETTAAIAALNANGNDLGAAVTSLFDAPTGAEFNRIWSAHNGFFVEYTVGVATNDPVKKTKATNDLNNTYVPEFAALLQKATNLPVETLASLTREHVMMTQAVIDAQAVKPQTDPSAASAAAADRMAGKHMQKIGDPVSKAIVAKLPTKF